MRSTEQEIIMLEKKTHFPLLWVWSDPSGLIYHIHRQDIHLQK